MTNQRYIDRESALIEYQLSFVQQSSGTPDNHNEAQQSCSSKGTLSGNVVKSIYEEIIQETQNDTDSQDTNSEDSKVLDSHTNVESVDDSPISASRKTVENCCNRMLRYASTGSEDELVDLLEEISNYLQYFDILNYTDMFGWNAIMCASAEGHLGIVKLLLDSGCEYENVTDTSGTTVFDICRSKKQWDVLNYLQSQERFSQQVVIEDEEEEEENDVKCDVCGGYYKPKERQKHDTSMMHLFKDKSKETAVHYGIQQNNRGYQLMLRSGWNQSSGLGPTGQGRKNPIATVLKQDRAGLGTKDYLKKRISHFDAHDKSAVMRASNKKSSDRVQKKYTKSIYEYKRRKQKNWEINLRREFDCE